MNTFYFNNKTEEIQPNKPKLSSVYIKPITTNKTFSTFLSDYENARKEGNSIVDSIEWAR